MPVSRLSPRQERKEKTFEIVNVAGAGQVDVGFPFIGDFEVTGATSTGSTPDLGLVSFAVGDVGKLVDVSFVTAPVYNVIRVIRTQDQIADHNGRLLVTTGLMSNGDATEVTSSEVFSPFAFVLHPTLAAPFGITLPVV